MSNNPFLNYDTTADNETDKNRYKEENLDLSDVSFGNAKESETENKQNEKIKKMIKKAKEEFVKESIDNIKARITTKSPKLSVPPICNELVAAPFDGEYYRAKVLSVKLKQVKVKFFDLPNTITVVHFDTLKKLPEHLLYLRYVTRVKIQIKPVN